MSETYKAGWGPEALENTSSERIDTLALQDLEGIKHGVISPEQSDNYDITYSRQRDGTYTVTQSSN